MDGEGNSRRTILDVSGMRAAACRFVVDALDRVTEIRARFENRPEAFGRVVGESTTSAENTGAHHLLLDKRPSILGECNLHKCKRE
jgi:hypothetical protein